MSGHSDAEADKKLFTGMMKKAMPKKVVSHLKSDMKEASVGIKKDKSLIKSFKPPKYSGRSK
jgi:hypothetical protein